MAVIMTGAALAQVISLAFAPVLTRLYGPELFGVLGAFAAALAVMAPVATLGYQVAIVLPRDDAEASAFARIAVRAGIAVSALLVVVTVLWRDPLAAALN
ncbi:oligosaccharide flippase family protein, partial [Georgenia sp. 10Sc9-8]|nr:oligosaccharide flippase family protein [Georgenia halotolerans]